MFLQANAVASAISGFLSGLVFSVGSNIPTFFVEERDKDFDFSIFARSAAFSSISTGLWFILISFAISSLDLIPETQIDRFMIGQGVTMALGGVVLGIGRTVVHKVAVSRSDNHN